MKLARISMAVIMLLAIVLRSLPDSVFNYFHSHTHVSYSDHTQDMGVSIEDHQHNCHIEDWNFESFEVIDQVFLPIQHSIQQRFSNTQYELVTSFTIPQIGRGPPIV